MGSAFEDICRRSLRTLNIPIFRKPGTKAGKWWYKDKEIGIVALNEQTKEILFCECKWQEKVNAKKVFEELKQKSQYVD